MTPVGPFTVRLLSDADLPKRGRDVLRAQFVVTSDGQYLTDVTS